MKRVCKKGGLILVQEPDHGIMDAYPESFAYLKLKQFYHKLFPDPLIGRKLESYFKKLNLQHITLQAAIACEMGKQHTIKRVFHLTGEAIGQALLSRQLLSHQEFEEFIGELARVEQDENTFLLSPLCLTATGIV